MDKEIYYITKENQIKSTDSVDDLIMLLYTGVADLISDSEIKKLKLDPNYNHLVRKEISLNQIRVPLYDIRFNHIYLIHKENVYPRIFYDNYRFVDKNFYDDLTKLQDLSPAEKENKRFLSYYDFDALHQTYLKIFYESFVLNEYITSCQRPSFNSGMLHIKPYYNLNELYYLALDWGLTNSTQVEIDQRKLCAEISSYDIPSKTLLDHQIYIVDNKAIGLVKNYSLFGSYFINRYLRKYGCCTTSVSETTPIKNSILENQIKLMIKLIRGAPAFTKSHTVYRFIESDHYLQHLKPSDTYVDPSFMSTTRNPWIYQDNYVFGYILLKIKIPANTIGIGLCIESYSNFPSEEEIIFPPTSVLELIKVTDQPESYHHVADTKLSLNKVKRKYEFVLKTNSFIMGKDIEINMLKPEFEPDIPLVNFEELFQDENIKYTSMADRLKYFSEFYVNGNSQFQSIINKNLQIKFILESYDSSTIYKEFFYYETNSGILMYSFHPTYGNINIMLELGPEIHVNYYFRYSVSDTTLDLDLDQMDWIKWLCFLSAVIGSRKVVIHSNYLSGYKKSMSTEEKQIKSRYTYSQTIYSYLKSGKKLFEKFNAIVPDFDYVQLDYLKQIPITDILKSTDLNELYKIGIESGIKFISDFYVYIMETHPSMLQLFETKLGSFYESNGTGINPLNSISYGLDPWMYLYNNNFIKYIPLDKEFNIKQGSFKKLIGDKKIPQFKNRLRYYLENK